jgi:SAM-dependent methyltransferase
VTRARFGDLRRTRSLSRWGSDRGQPVDRWYIERFLAERAHLVQGHALEVLEDLYASRLGAGSVDVLDIDAANPRATIVADVCEPGSLPAGHFDVALVTQTLQFVARPVDAVRNLLAALRPGGTLLLTVPSLSRIGDPSDRWRWTPLGIRDVLTEAAPPGAEVDTTGWGNGLAARAFLFGLAVEDVEAAILERTDPDFPVIVGGRVTLTS